MCHPYSQLIFLELSEHTHAGTGTSEWEEELQLQLAEKNMENIEMRRCMHSARMVAEPAISQASHEILILRTTSVMCGLHGGVLDGQTQFDLHSHKKYIQKVPGRPLLQPLTIAINTKFACRNSDWHCLYVLLVITLILGHRNVS